MKDLRVVRTQQRSFDKKYEYIFEVCGSTPSSRAVARTFMGGGGRGEVYSYIHVLHELMINLNLF